MSYVSQLKMDYVVGELNSEDEENTNFAGGLDTQKQDTNGSPGQHRTSGAAQPTKGRRMNWTKLFTEGKPTIASADPEICVNLLSRPSVKTYADLNVRLRQCSRDWLLRFLDARGFDVLMDSIDVMSAKRVTALADALTLLECVTCVKSIMNSKVGMEFLTLNHSLIGKLIRGRYISTHRGLNKTAPFCRWHFICFFIERKLLHFPSYVIEFGS